jgi:hypothetical protein
MSHGKHDDFRRKILIDNAEGKLSEGVFPEIFEVGGPAAAELPGFLLPPDQKRFQS